MSEEKLRALLAKARAQLPPGCSCGQDGCLGKEREEFLRRIDAALAEPVVDDFKRGAEAMREAAAVLVEDVSKLWLRSELAKALRALPTPKDK